MVLLRASSEAIGTEANLDATVGRGDGGIPAGAALVAFAVSATRGSAELSDARAELLAAVGPECLVEAAATVGIFNGLVRSADATGIPLDDPMRDASEEVRANLGLDAFGGSANTRPRTGPAPTDDATQDVAHLFGE